MDVALDVDSTIFPFHDAMALLPGAEMINARDDTYWGWVADQLGGQDVLPGYFAAAFTYDHMRRVGLLPGVVEELNALVDRGVRLHVMTRRNPNCAADTARFLADEGLRFVSFACEDPFDKVARCQQNGIGVIVDDHPGTIREAHTAGLRSLTLRYPFNAAVVDELRISHADTWTELAPMLAAAFRLT